MKALTLTQPWATLVAIGAKRIETRCWRTSYRGPLAIHAAKGYRKSDVTGFWRGEPFKSALHPAGNYLYPEFQAGSVIATCRLVACISTDCLNDVDGLLPKDARYVSNQDRAFGDFSPGRYAWYLTDVTRLTVPIPAKGALSLWEWNEEALCR